MRYIFALLFAVSLAFGQQIDLKSQSRNADFSTHAFIKPWVLGTSLPATCSVGDAFFDSNALAGQNVYVCTTTNVWTLSSGTGVWTSVATYGATGDGTTDDSAAIQAAINTVGAAGGGTVVFPAGTYELGGTPLYTQYSNITLKFEPGAGIHQTGNNVDGIRIGAASDGSFVQVHDIRIEGGSFIGDADGTGTNVSFGIVIITPDVAYANGSGGSSNITIDGVRMEGWTVGVTGQGATGLAVRNSHFTHMWYVPGLAMHGHGVLTFNCYRVWVENNQFVANSDGDRHAVYIAGNSEDVHVLNNVVHWETPNVTTGFESALEFHGAIGLDISGNTIIGGMMAGISLSLPYQDAQNITIARNIIRDTLSTGGPGEGAGIIFGYSATYRYENVVIVDNIVNQSNSFLIGIYATGADNLLLSGNTVSVSGASATTGIALYSCENAVVGPNNLNGNGVAGTGESFRSGNLAIRRIPGVTTGFGTALSNASGAEVLNATSQDATLITDLTADASPVGSTDYVMTYDASAGANKKVLVDDLRWGGTVPIANGGTGQTSQQAAIDALVPSQTSQGGKCLSTDGTTVSWAACGGGSLAIEANGVAVGSEATLNFIPGTGIVETITDAGTKINKTTAVDTAVMLTRAQAQSGADLLCAPASASGANYTCAMSPVLSAYTTGMVIQFVPDVSSSAGAVTLNIDSLGSLNVKQADGTTDPGAAGLVAGRQVPLVYDGTVFRMAAAGGGGASALDDLTDVTITTPAVRETLFNNGSGQFVNRGIEAADLPAGTIYDPLDRTWVYLVDEFMGGAVAAGGTSNLGELGWQTQGTTGASSYTAAGAVLGHPGKTAELRTGTADTDTAYLALGAGASGSSTLRSTQLIGSGKQGWSMEFELKTDSSITDVYLGVGWITNHLLSTAFVATRERLTIEYDTAQGDTEWMVVARSSGGVTRIPTGVAVVADTYYRLKLFGNNAGELQGSINGGSPTAAIASNMPADASGHIVFIVQTHTAAMRKLWYDRFAVKIRR